MVSALTGVEYPFERLEEFADNGEALEVALAGIEPDTATMLCAVRELFVYMRRPSTWLPSRASSG